MRLPNGALGCVRLFLRGGSGVFRYWRPRCERGI